MNILALFFALAVAGTDPVFPDTAETWNGLMLDESTVEDAVALLGKPKKDKDSQRFNTDIHVWLADLRYRKLEFGKILGMDKVNLYFLNDYLKVIELDMDDPLPARELPHRYSLRFFMREKFGGLYPDPYERRAGDRVPEIESSYHIIGIGDSSFLVAVNTWGGLTGLAYRTVGVREMVPGYVQALQLVSRMLQDSDAPNKLAW
jgi:hypothetical protein